MARNESSEEKNNISTDEFLDTNNKVKSRKNSKFNILEVFSLIIITMIISLFFGFLIGKKIYSVSLSKNMKNFISDFNDIKNNYYREIDEEKVLDSALKNVINSIDDPYSTVVDKVLSNSINTELKGEYSGFGIQIANTNDDKIIIVSVIANSPALKAGLKSGDIILKMDDISLDNKTTQEFTDLVKKSNKKEINLTISRNNKVENIVVTREIIKLQSVISKTYERNNKKIGYIYISIFAENTDVQFKDELKKLENDKIDSLLIDVRDNTGGHLTSVENIMNEIFDKTHVIYQIQDKNKTIKHYSTGNKTKKYPIAILVNNNSASASEMLTAALKEEYNANVIGEKTFGKGTVQEVGYTNNTSIEYKLTTKKWLTPKGNWINKKGIEPTVKVKLDDEYKKNPSDESDNQLQKALEIISK